MIFLISALFYLNIVHLGRCWLGYEQEIKKYMPKPIEEPGEVFVFQVDNSLIIHQNWLNMDIPCDSDRIRIDPEKEIVMRVEEGLKVGFRAILAS